MTIRKAALFLSLLFLAWPRLDEAQTSKVENIRTSFASFGVIYYPHFIAKELNFYQDEGLNIEIIAMPGGLATQALVAGDLQFSTSSGSSLNASLRVSSSKWFTSISIGRCTGCGVGATRFAK